MKNIFILIGMFAVIFYKAQQVFPLNKSAYSSPNNSYFKDLNNELNHYAGTWLANFQGKSIKLLITKQLKAPFKISDKNNFRDQLVVRYEVRNNTGSILQSSLNLDFSNSKKYLISSYGTNLNSNNEINLLYSGGNCSVGIGDITFKKVNNTQFTWSYYPGTTTSIDSICPPNRDYTIYLPETEGLIFTKQ